MGQSATLKRWPGPLGEVNEPRRRARAGTLGNPHLCHREQDLWEDVGSKKSMAERGKWLWEPKVARVGVKAAGGGGAFVGEATKSTKAECLRSRHTRRSWYV